MNVLRRSQEQMTGIIRSPRPWQRIGATVLAGVLVAGAASACSGESDPCASQSYELSQLPIRPTVGQGLPLMVEKLPNGKAFSLSGSRQDKATVEAEIWSGDNVLMLRRQATEMHLPPNGKTESWTVEIDKYPVTVHLDDERLWASCQPKA